MKTKSYKNGSNDFIVLGTNANGILSKMESLRLLFDKFKPAVVFLQETKVTRKGQNMKSLKLLGQIVRVDQS